MQDPASREECESLLLEIPENRALKRVDPAAFQEKVDLAWEVYGPGGQELLDKERARKERVRTHGRRINAEVELAGTHVPERQVVIRKVQVYEGMEVKFAREPSNVHDSNAIKVFTKKGAFFGFGRGTFLGYVPRDMAARMAPRMDRGIPFEGKVVATDDMRIWFRVTQLSG